jgi:hypothetical protein
LPLETLELVDQLLERWDSLENSHRAQIARALLKRVSPQAEDIDSLGSEQLRGRLKALLEPAPPAHVI